MADHLFIVPGYSDEDFSFVPIRNLLIEKGLYAAQNIRSIEYASLDDQVGFRDFADRLEDLYTVFLRCHPDTRIDVLAHSKGSLVVRSWLYMRRLRQKRHNSIDPGIKIDCPVDHLFLFAPANFGSDLARLGRSGLNATLVTFTKTVKQSATLAGNRDLFETGKRVLEGLEPASPTQWELSLGDLHQETYFGEHDVSGQHCFPFIFAAGKFETSLRSTFVRNLQKDGTDSTVRIAGTSLNTRLFTLRSSRKAKNNFCEVNVDNELIPGTMNRRKYGDIAFAIFGDYDHCGIINDNGNCKKGKHEDDASWRNSTCLPNQWGPWNSSKKPSRLPHQPSTNQPPKTSQRFGRITSTPRGQKTMKASSSNSFSE